eukprot:6031232-Pleurochrysis_carterae.AAC.3
MVFRSTTQDYEEDAFRLRSDGEDERDRKRVRESAPASSAKERCSKCRMYFELVVPLVVKLLREEWLGPDRPETERTRLGVTDDVISELAEQVHRKGQVRGIATEHHLPWVEEEAG